MSAGAVWTAPQMQQDNTWVGGSLIGYFARLQQIEQRINDVGWANVNGIWVASYGSDPAAEAKGADDTTQMQMLYQAVGAVQQFAVAVQPTGLPLVQSAHRVIDGTAAGFTPQTVTVQPGQKAYIADTPEWQAQYDSVGVDKGAAIRAVAPMNPV